MQTSNCRMHLTAKNVAFGPLRAFDIPAAGDAGLQAS